MAHQIKQYGSDFTILGKREGWHYGIWRVSIPSCFVFVKPLNKKDFIFCDISAMKDGWPNPFCGVIKTFWFSCIDGTYEEISEEEAQKLLSTKLDRYKDIPELKPGDTIYVLDLQNSVEEDIFVECKYIEQYFVEDGLRIRYETPFAFDSYVKADDYGETWKTKM